MTLERAIQILDRTKTNHLTMNISEYDEALTIARECISEKIERDNPKPLTFLELMDMIGEPVWLYDYGVYHWALVSGCMDYTNSKGEKGKLVNFIFETDNSYPGDSFPLDCMGDYWIAYKYKPKESKLWAEKSYMKA